MALGPVPDENRLRELESRLTPLLKRDIHTPVLWEVISEIRFLRGEAADLMYLFPPEHTHPFIRKWIKLQEMKTDMENDEWSRALKTAQEILDAPRRSPGIIYRLYHLLDSRQPETPELLVEYFTFLAKISYMTQNFSIAENYLNRALAVQPDHPGARKFLEQLRSKQQ